MRTESQYCRMDARWTEEGQLLADLIDQRYDTRSEFARDLGVSSDVVHNLCKGITRLTGDRRKRAAVLLRVSPEALRPSVAKHRDPILPDNAVVRDLSPKYTTLGRIIPVSRAGIKVVPVYGAVPAGRPGRSMSDAVDFVELPEWGGDFDRWGRIIEGDSMQPEFEDGDIVIFENRQALPGQAVHAMRDGEDLFKILTESAPGKGELAPMNERYQSIPADGWQIIGVAIMRVRYSMGPFGFRDTREYPMGYKHRAAVRGDTAGKT